jgi:hypothetical protein
MIHSVQEIPGTILIEEDIEKDLKSQCNAEIVLARRLVYFLKVDMMFLICRAVIG